MMLFFFKKQATPLLRIMCVCLALTLLGCKSNILPLQSETPQPQQSTLTIERNFVEKLHLVMQHSEVRDAFLAQLTEKDTEILLLDFLQVPLESKSFPQANTIRDLFGTTDEVFLKSSSGYGNIVDSLIALHPDTELKLADAWTEEEFANASYLPVAHYYGFIDPATYDRYSEEGWDAIDAIIPPEAPHLFVGRSEDHVLISKSSPPSGWNPYGPVEPKCQGIGINPAYEDEEVTMYNIHDYYILVDCVVNNDSISQPPSTPKDTTINFPFKTNYPCPMGDRETNDDKDNILNIRFESKNALDDAFRKDNGWGNKDIELRASIAFMDQNGGAQVLTKSFSVKKRWLRKNPLFGSYELLTFTANAEVFTWQDEFNGSNMAYTWIEEDGGDPITLTSNFTTTVPNPNTNPPSTTTVNQTVAVMINDEDQILDGSIVEYCDDTEGDGTSYTTGMLIFRINQ